MTRRHAALCLLSQRIRQSHARRKTRQRQFHLKRLAQYLRHKLRLAYPDGYNPAHAAHLLSDGDLYVKALQRVEHGTYGTCGDCHQDIPLLELWASPQRLYCHQCELKQDTPPPRQHRFVL